MLHTILPTATTLGIQVAMYADDFSLWNTGYSIPSLATNLSILINKHIVPWLETYNMKLSIWKCHSFLFTLYHRDPKTMHCDQRHSDLLWQHTSSQLP